MTSTFSDYLPSPNIKRSPTVYERENEAIERDGRLQHTLRCHADWSDKVVVDLGCGTGFWLLRYPEATRVIGVEPDPEVRRRAIERVQEHTDPRIEIVAGSAENIPLPNASVDIVHARWAYFWGPGCEAGIAEVMRILKPGGVFVMVDNDRSEGDFARLLEGISNATGEHAAIEWWAARGATRTRVSAGWVARNTAELERILRIEFPAEVVDRFLATHAGPSLSYSIALYGLVRPH